MAKSRFLLAIFDGPVNMDKSGIHGAPKYNVTVRRGQKKAAMKKLQEWGIECW